MTTDDLSARDATASRTATRPPVTFVVRSCGERTEAACVDSLAATGRDEVRVIAERPFAKAVVRTFEVGREAGHRWTIAVDADVLLRPGAVDTLVAIAEAGPDHLFEAEGRLFDNFFRQPRWCGVHLYRTSLLGEALGLTDGAAENHRPETFVIGRMKAAGYAQIKDEAVLGLHDFGQTYADCYRKGFVHAQKHLVFAEAWVALWGRLAEHEREFAVALQGAEAGLAHAGVAATDAAFFERHFAELAAREKGRDYRDVHESLPPFAPADVTAYVEEALARLGPAAETAGCDFRTGAFAGRTRPAGLDEIVGHKLGRFLPAVLRERLVTSGPRRHARQLLAEKRRKLLETAAAVAREGADP